MFAKTMVRRLLAAAAASTLLFDGAWRAQAAQSVYNFEDVSVGTSTPFSETEGGITATFSSPADPGGFQIVMPSFAPPISGNVLLDPGPSNPSSIPLNVSFSQPLSSLSADFVTDGSGPFELFAYSGSTPVGSATATGSIPAGYSFPQGVISFGGATFDNIVMESPGTPYFAVDNIAVTPVPEPSSLALLCAGAIALLGYGWRQRLAT